MTTYFRLTVYLDNGMLVGKDCASSSEADMCMEVMLDGGHDDIAVNGAHVVLTTVTQVDPSRKGRDPYLRARLIKGTAD